MKYSAYIVIALMALLAACTKADICEEAEHPHKAGVQFAFDWAGVNNDPRAAYHDVEPGTKDSMLVIAKRIIGTRITGCRVGAKDGNGFYLFDGFIGNATVTTPADDGGDGGDEGDGDNGGTSTDDGGDGSNPADGGSPVDDGGSDSGSDSGSGSDDSGSDSGTGSDDDGGDIIVGAPADTRATTVTPSVPGYTDPTDLFRVQPGTFKFVAVNFDSDEFVYDELYDYVETGVTTNTYMRDLCVSYKRYRYNSPLLHNYLPDWPDYNVYGPRDEYGIPTGENYLQPDLMPVYYDSISPMIIDKNTTQTFTFKPSILTQNVDIYFDIHKVIDGDDGTPFAIDTVCAEISGIPYRLNLTHDVFDIKNTGKMRFECWREDDGGTRIKNKDTETSTDLHYHGNIDVLSIVNSENGEAYRGPGIMQLMIKIQGMKTIHARINLHQTIAKAKLLNSTSDGLWAYRRKDHGVLKVEAVLTIDKNAVLPSEHSGLDIWVDAGKDNILVDT